jgi:cyclopropane-fatty-acyl-phospholipid synthase
MRFLPVLLDWAVRQGRLRVTGPKGETHEFGDGDAPGAAIRVTDPRLDWRIFLNPELHAAEAYMDGALVMEEGDVRDLMDVYFANRNTFDLTPNQIFWRGLARWGRRFLTHNTISRARANARAHYDIGNDLYRAMLDRDMQYSCGYWPDDVSTLEEAQTAKKRHIAAKLALEPGQRVLDIGCGWGGMALYLAAVADVEVVGVTLAEEQLKIARARAEALGLSHRVRFELCDYREAPGRFDRVVSVGMLEHVGPDQLKTYFLNVRDRLAPGGVALIHAITSMSPPGPTGPFIRKHIFPGGYVPSLSEVFPAIERSGLWTLDTEIWRVHYARTLKAWRDNFLAARDTLAEHYDARFQRMWELYLAACEAVFARGTAAVFQIQLGRTRDAVPLTRDYIAQAAAGLAARESQVLERLLDSTQLAFATVETGRAGANR